MKKNIIQTTTPKESTPKDETKEVIVISEKKNIKKASLLHIPPDCYTVIFSFTNSTKIFMNLLMVSSVMHEILTNTKDVSIHICRSVTFTLKFFPLKPTPLTKNISSIRITRASYFHCFTEEKSKEDVMKHKTSMKLKKEKKLAGRVYYGFVPPKISKKKKAMNELRALSMGFGSSLNEQLRDVKFEEYDEKWVDLLENVVKVVEEEEGENESRKLNLEKLKKVIKSLEEVKEDEKKKKKKGKKDVEEEVTEEEIKIVEEKVVEKKEEVVEKKEVVVEKKEEVVEKKKKVVEKEKGKTMTVHEYVMLHHNTKKIEKVLRKKHAHDVWRRLVFVLFQKKFRYFKNVFKSFPNLKVFHAPGILMTRDIEEYCMKRCKQLVSMNVSDSKFTGRGLKHMPNLAILNVSNCRCFHHSNWMYVVELKKLHTLNVSSLSTISDSFLEMIKGKKLSCLSLNGCSNITNVGMSHISEMPLVVLNIRGTQVTDDGLLYIRKIKWLNIQKTKVTDAGVKLLTEVETLLLTLQYHNVHNPIQRTTGITGSTLGDLKKLKNLTVNDISENFFVVAATLFLKEKSAKGYVLRSLILLGVRESLKRNFQKAVDLISNGVKNVFIERVTSQTILSLSNLKNVHTLSFGKISGGSNNVSDDVGPVVRNRNIRRVYVGSNCFKRYYGGRKKKKKKKKKKKNLYPKEFRI